MEKDRSVLVNNDTFFLSIPSYLATRVRNMYILETYHYIGVYGVVFVIF